MKSEKTNPGKGVQPESNALYYRMDMPDGSRKYATIPAYQVDHLGRYKAWVMHPDFGTELMTEREGRLEGFKPVIALTQDDLPALIEQITAAVMEKLKGSDAKPEPKAEKKPRAAKVEGAASSDEVDVLSLIG
jgi:hypothetical protein